MVKFCSECGTKIEYNFSPPKFCSNCGAPLGIATVNESKPINRNVRANRKSEAISDNETDAEEDPLIEKLEYEIDTFGSDIVHTIGSLAGKQAPNKRKVVRRDIDEL